MNEKFKNYIGDILVEIMSQNIEKGLLDEAGTDYIAQRLGLGKKTAHEGHELWLKVMNNDKSAWKRMEEYNRNDVVLLEKVYDKFKGWISNHPNHNHFSEERVCPSCASHKVQQRGYSVLTAGKYPRFQCQQCGSWFRGNKKLTSDKSEKFVKI